MYCLRQFIAFFTTRTTLFTTMFTVIIVVRSLKSMCIPSFVLIGYCVHGHTHMYVPIVMYGLRLFIVVLHELHCLLNCLHVCMIRIRGWYHITKLPEAVYSCFTRTTLFTTTFTVMIVVCLKSMCIPSFVLIGCCVSELLGHLCPYRNVLPEAVYCCFTRTTLFTELFTCLHYQS